MAKQKISKELFELQKALSTGKVAKQVGTDADGDAIYEIAEYDVDAALREKFEIEGE